MLQTSILSQFIKYASLNALGMLGISCYILADTFFIANGIGMEGLAALNLAIPVYSFIHGCALMLGFGSATKFSLAFSQNEQNRANAIFTNSLLGGICFALIFIITGVCCSRPIAALLGAEKELLEMTNIYLKIILLFSPFFISNEIFLAFVRNDNAPALSMFAMICGSLSNILLDYIFIYPLKMGITGAALATGIAPIISMSILSVHLLQNNQNFHYQKDCFNMSIIGSSITLGFPSLIAELSSGLIMIVFNLIIMKLAGSPGVAAYGIIANIALVTGAIYAGISQGIQPLISTAYGNHKSSDMYTYMKYSLATVIILSGIIYYGIYKNASEITILFNSKQIIELQTISEAGLILYFSSLLFTGINVILSVFFTSTDNPFPAHLLAILRGFVLVLPITYILSSAYQLTGVWLSVPITELVTAIIGCIIWIKRKPQL